MVDLVFLPSKEQAVIDTATAITSILLLFGSVNITDTSGNTVAILSGDIEIYTLPANSGKYVVKNDTDNNSKVAIIRMFYI
jgi:hypothetical protein